MATSPESPPAVVLGGSFNAVSVARSLGRAGIAVHSLGGANDLVRHSRHCSSHTDVGTGVEAQSGYRRWLEAGPSGAVVLACADEGLEFIARNRDLLDGLGYRPMEADDEAVLAMLDKERSYALARSAGVPAPRTFPVGTETEVAGAAAQVGFPCALKPRASHVFARRFAGKAFVATSLPELLHAFALTDGHGVEMLLTEIVAGPDDGFHSYYGYLDEDGATLLDLTKRKLRQCPAGFGSGCYHVTDWDPEVAELGLRFLRAAGVRGLACVEFKRDGRDGQLKFIECNHRFTAANELWRIAGVDLALFSYERLTNGRPARVERYRTGVYLWHPLEDIRALRQYRRRGELTVGAWLRSLLHRPRFPLLRLDDPLPSAAGMASTARGGLRRLAAALRDRM
jgi:D-aspartate ligase